MSELQAWAAGFFDGEGNTHRSKDRAYFRVSVPQNDPEVLEKFMEAVGGIGKIYGPYTTKKNPYWVYDASNLKAIVVLSKIWPWLGRLKRDQAIEALERFSFTYLDNEKRAREDGVCIVEGCQRLGQRKCKNGPRKAKCRRCYEGVAPR